MPDPEALSWGRLLLATATVAGLMGLFAFALKFFTTRGLPRGKHSLLGPRRLKLVETLALDLRRRLVIVRCDDKEHLLLLGQNGDLIVDSSLSSAPQAESDHE